MRRQIRFLAFVTGCCLISASAFAAIEYNENVTGNMIFGTGNSNGGFTVDRVNVNGNDIELGLRAKVRYPTPSDAPVTGVRIINNETYGYFDATGHGLGNTLASWNVDWSINSGTANLNAYKYTFQLDYDPGLGTSFQPAYFETDPINLTLLPFLDHSFGTNSTGAGLGTEATDSATYASLVASNNLVQNSLNFGFFNSSFDPTADGHYAVQLTAFDDQGTQLAQSTIYVLVGNGVVPEATSLLTWGGIISCIGLVRRRRNA